VRSAREKGGGGARQRIFPGKVVLGHPPVSELVARVAFEDKTDTEDGAMKEEVSRGKSHRVVIFRKEREI
jgi:hypothetical protein